MRSLPLTMVLIGALASGGTATALSQGANPAAVKAKPRVMLKACVDLKTYKATIMPKRFYCPKNSKYISLTPIKHPVSKIAINGSGAPIDNVTGKDGDVYIDVVNLLIYGPRENGVWGPGKSLLGAAGAPGAPGAAGAKGDTGTAGAPGAPGVAGPMGPQGVPGVAGAPGPVGATGPAGVNGSTILTGSGVPAPETGTVGDYYIDLTNNDLYGPKTLLGWGVVISTVGPQGPQGDPGIAGPPGPAGADGTDGVNGSTILTGSGVPDGALGAVGDYYIDTVTANLYGPKTVLGWGAVVSTVGPQGPQGIQGIQGVPGPIGPQGETGTVISYFGAFHDQSTIILAADTTVPIPLGVTDLSNGVTSSGATGIVTIANAGIYNIAFSTVFDKTNSNAGDVYVWMRHNGVDMPWSGTVVTISGSSRMVAAWNFFVAAAAGDTFQLMVRTPASTIQILTVAASADVPAIPSTILTVNQVGAYVPLPV